MIKTGLMIIGGIIVAESILKGILKVANNIYDHYDMKRVMKLNKGREKEVKEYFAKRKQNIQK